MNDSTPINSAVRPGTNQLWLIFIILWTVAFPVYLVLSYTGQSLMYLLAAVSAAAAVVIGVRVHNPRQSTAWYAFAVGLALATVADALFEYYDLTRDDGAPFPSLADVFYLAFYAAMAFGLLLLVRSGSRRRDLGSYIDAAVITASAALLSWAFIVSPLFSGQDLPFLELLVSVSYPVFDLLMVALIARLALNASSRVPSVFILLIGFVLYLIADAIYGFQVLHDSYQSGGVLDFGWLIGYVAIGVAALHPSMRQVEEQAYPSGEQVTWRRIAVLTAIPVASLGALALQDILSASTGSTATIAGALILFALALCRVALLARDVVVATEEVRVSQERYDLVSLATNDVIWDFDPRTEIIDWSDAIRAHFGHGDVGPALTWWEALIHPDDRVRVSCSLQDALDGDGETWSDDYRMRRGDGSYANVVDRGFIVRDSEGRPVRMVGMISDVSMSKKLEEQLQYQAFHDSLTGLHNREVFRERLVRAMTSTPDGSSRIAVLFVDVDRFKHINDTLGHGAGDELLIEVSRRLRQCIRASDTLSRQGGDEFTILLDGADEEQACAAAQRIGTVLREPIVLGSQEVVVTASIGIALGGPGEARADDMLRAADVAMYDAKARGRARFEIFDDTRDPFTVEALTLEVDLRRAVERNEFTLVYQPMVDLASGRTMFLEALVRWQHPERGLLSPAEFLAVAEDTGLIVPIGRQVLDAVMSQIAWWMVGMPDTAIPPVFVNCSPREFRDLSLARDIQARLQQYGLEGHQIGIEINEQVVLADAEAASQTIELLRSMGVHLALDDFGTGNSSLSHLRHLPVDILKIDKSFVSGLDGVSNDRVLTRALIAVGTSLGIRVLAEGIETSAQMAILKEMGSELGQGYHFARPMPPEHVPAFLQRSAAPRGPRSLAAG